MTKTLKELLELDNIISLMFKRDPELSKTKFAYAWQRFSEKNIKQPLADFREGLQALRVDHALTDEKTGEILKDDADTVRGFKYNKTEFKALIKAENKLGEKFDAMEIEIEPFITTDLPRDITLYELEKLAGIILPAIEKAESSLTHTTDDSNHDKTS